MFRLPQAGGDLSLLSKGLLKLHTQATVHDGGLTCSDVDGGSHVPVAKAIRERASDHITFGKATKIIHASAYNPSLVNQLCGLERRTARSGKDSIDHAPGAHDDLANAAAGALTMAAAERGPIRIGAATLERFARPIRRPLYIP